MRFKSLFLSAVFLILPLVSVSAHADNFVYSVGNHFSGFQVDGTITTDTNAGILSFANIIDFNLLLTGGGQTESLTYSNAQNSGVVGDALSATASGLYFDYDLLGAAFYLQNTATGTYLCYQTQYCDTATVDSHESIAFGGVSPLSQSQSGLVQIASLSSSTTVTPEPSSLLLLATGTVAAGVGSRRWRVR